MASQTIESYRAGADVVRGDEAACKKASAELGLPKGLFPLDGMQEFGYNRAAGFVWLVQGRRKCTSHTFKKIKQTVSYAGEVTAFVEKGRLKKIAGVRTSELMLWLSVVEVYVDESALTFKTGTGLSHTFDATCL